MSSQRLAPELGTPVLQLVPSRPREVSPEKLRRIRAVYASREEAWYGPDAEFEIEPGVWGPLPS